MPEPLDMHALTRDRLADLATLFEADSNTRSCWCMFWRLQTAEFRDMSAKDKRAGFEARVKRSRRPPGIIAYDGNGPAGWVQVTPREELPHFQSVPTAKPAADTPRNTWALSCFFLRKDLRRTGLMSLLARGGCAYAMLQGASAVEVAARRIGPEENKLAFGDGFTGLVPALKRAGFREIEDRTPQRVLMRWTPN